MNIIPTRNLSAILLIAVIAATGASAWAVDTQDTSPDKENELLAVLRSDAPGAEKAIACKNLAIHGSDAAVPELANLLPDPQLSSWARIALESIPGPAADEALRTAADSLEGRLLIGMINSIGVRRDAHAVDSLAEKLQDANADAASAAAVALGHIGNPAATELLRTTLATAHEDIRSAVAEGCVLCAERLLSEGDAVAAIEIYDEVRRADVPMQRIIEATRGAILARNQDGIPLLLELLQSPEKKMFQLALGTAREFPGNDVDKELAAETARATPDRAALIIQAMADRPDTLVLSAVLSSAQEGPKVVRLSAIDALERVGNDSCLSPLLEIAAGNDADLSRAAKDTIAVLPGNDVDAQIVRILEQAGPNSDTLMLELVGRRRIDAVPHVLKALEHSDQKVRHAALVALGQIVTLTHLPVLVSQVVDSRDAGDVVVAQAALRAASVRMPDRDACVTELANALPRSSSATKTTLLEILSDVGGSKALQTLAIAANSSDPQQQDTGSRLLGKWNNLEAAPVLLNLAKSASANKYKVRGLRGYLGLARKFSRGKQRADMCQIAIDAAIRREEQTLALEVLALRPDVEGLKVAIKAQELPGLKDAAAEAAQSIAEELSRKGVDVSKLITLPAPQ
ncbi:MAG: HEAT repeat domain-containing protein [Planctomycetaceae bacterium]